MRNCQILPVFLRKLILLQIHFGSGAARIRNVSPRIRILLKVSDPGPQHSSIVNCIPTVRDYELGLSFTVLSNFLFARFAHKLAISVPDQVGFVINWPPGSGSVILNCGSGSRSFLFYKDSKTFQKKGSILYLWSPKIFGSGCVINWQNASIIQDYGSADPDP